jgi:hypothetical protein
MRIFERHGVRLLGQEEIAHEMPAFRMSPVM